MAGAHTGKAATISDKFLPYAKIVSDQLKNSDIRAEIDDRSEENRKKIRDTELAKIPYMLVLGEKEMNEGTCIHPQARKG
jgi:threonyl-tRNA synthetase